ncbi:MAG: DUF4446 family protein [bacterium]
MQFNPDFSNLVFDGKDIIVLSVTGLIALISIIVAVSTRIKMKKMLKGTKPVTLEQSVMEIVKSIHDLEDFQEDSIKLFKQFNSRIHTSIRAVETLRYNAFTGMGTGGNQSFTSVFSDEKGDGLIITGLFASESMRVFAKPMNEFESKFELTHEEHDAVKLAKEKVLKPHHD